MNIGAIVSRARKAAADNTPTILTALGVTGTIATAVLVGKASFKAAEVLKAEEGSRAFSEGEIAPLPTKEKVELIWKLYIPAVTTGAVTLACTITANRVSSRRAAALASAYSISQEAFREYKDKVVEKIGEKKEQAVRDEITQAHVDKNPAAALVLVDSKILCYDTHSGRYFQSDLETIRKAINDINWQIFHDCYASVSDFWDKIDLPSTKDSDEIGWNMETKFEVEYSAALTGDGKPVLAIDFNTVPVRGYYRIN